MAIAAQDVFRRAIARPHGPPCPTAAPAGPRLRLAGLMTIPPPTPDAAQTRAWFRSLRELSDRARERHGDALGSALSMGMSDDFELAIEEGATHVRVGTALFGARA